MKPIRLCLYALLCLALNALAACTSDKTEEKPIQNAAMLNTAPFALPAELAMLKTDIRRMDIRRIGYEDALVTVYPKDAMGARIGFEALQIFEYDTTKQVFQRVHEEKVYYGKSLDVKDIDGDGIAEICIQTDGGGNSALASIGLTILKKQNGRYSRIVGFDAGNPEIITLTSNGTNISAVLMSNEYWPEYLPHSEAVAVIDSIVVLAQTPEEATKLTQKFFDEHLAKAEQRYDEAKSVLKANRSEQTILAVYSEAVAVISLMQKSSRSANRPSYLATERAYWRAMLPKRYQQALQGL
jgi:hypothetical protein